MVDSCIDYLIKISAESLIHLNLPVLERIGKFFPVLLERYQQFLKEYGLVDNKQIIDFSSTYLEGEKAEFASYGYSRKGKRKDTM